MLLAIEVGLGLGSCEAEVTGLLQAAVTSASSM
jgi:hypothetical protein